MTVDAVNSLQVDTEPTASHFYGRGLAPWCTSRAKLGSMNNINFWGCSYWYDPETTIVDFLNDTLPFATWMGRGDDQIFNYTDSDGVQYAVLGPSRVDSSIDWKASTFGASTQCTAIPAKECEAARVISNTTEQAGIPFKCNRTYGGKEFAGIMTEGKDRRTYLNAHKYFVERDFFQTQRRIMNGTQVNEVAPTVTDEQSSEIFSNPWDWLAAPRLSNPPPKGDPLVITTEGLVTEYIVMLECNSTSK